MMTQFNDAYMRHSASMSWISGFQTYIKEMAWSFPVKLPWDKWHKYGPVTMIVPASGHQDRCIPWEQMGTFNKEIGFLCGLKFFALNFFVGNTYDRVHLMLQIW